MMRASWTKVRSSELFLALVDAPEWVFSGCRFSLHLMDNFWGVCKEFLPNEGAAMYTLRIWWCEASRQGYCSDGETSDLSPERAWS